MAIKNYTTKIDAYKTISDIQKLLSKNGAQKIVIDNDQNGNPIALTFTIDWNGQQNAYALPCNFSGVLKSLKKSGVAKSLQTEEQAVRIGWRVILDWVTAQLAFREAEMCSLPEIFLPYAVTKSGEILYQYIENNQQLLLTQ
jgi:glucan biosynthesis protein